MRAALAGPAMSARRLRSSSLWGLVGLLSFLVLAQGYRLFVGPLGLRLPSLVLVGLAIGVVTTAASYVLEPRLAPKGRT
jgi:hypothetical protein